jgi:hypothetical protein
MEKRCTFRREYKLFSKTIWTFWLELYNITVRTKEELAAERARQYSHRKHQTKAFHSSTNKEKPSIESFENFDSSSFSLPTTPTNSLQPSTPSKTKFSSQSSPQNRL